MGVREEKMAKPFCKMTLKELLDYLAAQEKQPAEPVLPEPADLSKIEIVPIPRRQVKIDQAAFAVLCRAKRGYPLSLN